MLELRPGPAYRIETERLVLRCYQPADAPLLIAAIDASLDSLRPWMPWARDEPRPLPEKMNLLRQFRGMFDLGQDFSYGAFNPGETELLGSSGLHTRVGPDAREIGYWVHAAHAGQGLATEIVAALTRVGFEVEKLHRIEIHCAPDNARSIAVARKLGYVHEATLRQRMPRSDGSRRDTMIWSLFASDYADSPAAGAKIRAFDAIGQGCCERDFADSAADTGQTFLDTRGPTMVGTPSPQVTENDIHGRLREETRRNEPRGGYGGGQEQPR